MLCLVRFNGNVGFVNTVYIYIYTYVFKDIYIYIHTYIHMQSIHQTGILHKYLLRS